MDPLVFVALGASIGLVAGLSPGPVLTLVLSETLTGGWPRGAAIAAGPLLADGPIIILAVVLIGQLPSGAQPLLSAAGGLFLLYLAVTTLLASRHDLPTSTKPVRLRTAFAKGIMARALSPNPYLFWFFVGAPLLHQGQPVPFLLGYYATIVGSNVLLALAIHRWLRTLPTRVYRAVLTVGALILAAYGVLFLARARA